MANNIPNPYRLQFKFWLDVTRADEESIADIIEKLKNARRFSATIRDGLRLMWDLSQGKTDVLLELFPFVRGALAGNSGGNAEGVSKEDIERLEKLIRESKLISNEAAPVLKPLGGLKSIQAPTFAAPKFDEEDEDLLLPVGKASGDGLEATQNFLKSMMALQQ